MVLAKGGWAFLDLEPRNGSRFGSVLLTYRTTALGALNLTTDDLKISGRIIKVVRRPAEAHGANWDCTVKDADAVTLTTNTSCHTTNTETDEPSLVNTYFLPIVKGTLNLVIAGTGDGVNGVVEVFYER